MKNVRIRTLIDSKGEIGDARIDANLRGDGSALGKAAVTKLSVLIKEMNAAETVEDMTRLSYVILGYLTCCGVSGFLTEESVDDVMQMVACMVEKERNRSREEREEDGSRKEKINDKD